MFPWVKDPNAGGVKISPAVQQQVKQRVLGYTAVHYAGKYTRLDLRFRSHFCYIDAYKEPDCLPDFLPKDFPVSREEYLERMRNSPIHPCWLRYVGDEESWSLGFYTYRNEKYELCMFKNDSFYGTPEKAFTISAMYLQ